MTHFMRSRRTPSRLPASRPAHPSARRGMTLIEVMIALSIITTSMLGLGAFLPNFMHVSAKGTILSAASDLAVSRVETIKAWTTYSTMASTFNATETTGLTGCTGCTRVTLVTHTTSATSDYNTVSVTVTGPMNVLPVRLSFFPTSAFSEAPPQAK
jgi:prepilin-type N-terminal cleavage/methylation domain-containing protein